MLAIKNIEWIGDARAGRLRLLDQTKLPEQVVYLDCDRVEQVADAIKCLAVRGAPAIGVAAAYGCVIGVQAAGPEGAGASEAQRDALGQAASLLASSRPTAVNLFWALDRMQCVSAPTPDALLAEARAIHEQDAAMCEQIGRNTVALIEKAVRAGRPAVLTHCNAGALATGGIGTATAGMYLAKQNKLAFRVYADETRPLLQGARLTVFELLIAGIDVELICDSAAAQVMRGGEVGMVITGADRIAANGDSANKVGTYSLAVLARHHGIPFYVAAPSSTFDRAIADGAGIPIEHRDAEEIVNGFGRRTAPSEVVAHNPAFDVTPHELIEAIITEKGLIQPVNADTVAQVLGMSVTV